MRRAFLHRIGERSEIGLIARQDCQRGRDCKAGKYERHNDCH